jgi:hypothetical protein
MRTGDFSAGIRREGATAATSLIGPSRQILHWNHVGFRGASEAGIARLRLRVCGWHGVKLARCESSTVPNEGLLCSGLAPAHRTPSHPLTKRHFGA